MSPRFSKNSLERSKAVTIKSLMVCNTHEYLTKFVFSTLCAYFNIKNMNTVFVIIKHLNYTRFSDLVIDLVFTKSKTDKCDTLEQHGKKFT